MPRMNRVRVTNIQYDNGKKQLPDITFHIEGLNTVLLLANGGGKTLLLQLILQAVLPNERLNGRSIADLLQNDRYTGHVAVEWLLDHPGEQRHFVCTGFCFSNGRHEDENIRYFTYLFDYDERSQQNISTLPLLQSEAENSTRRPIGFQQLRDWLKQDGGLRVQLFDTNKNYQERLRMYQILPEEWKSIRDTNGSEGGVEAFFSKSKTTQQLMENLLIPNVEEMIFQSERKKKELYYAFSEYRKILLEIPVIKQNIKDFELIRQHAETVVAQVHQYDQGRQQYEEKTRQLIRLAKTFRQHEQQAEQELIRLNQQQEQLKTELHDIDWKIGSYKVFLKQLDFEAAVDAEKVQQTAYQAEVEQWEQLQRIEKQSHALYYDRHAEEAKAEVNRYQQELERMDRDEPELKEELTDKKKTLTSAWHRQKDTLTEQQSRLEERVVQARKALQHMNKELEASQTQRDHLVAAQAQVNAWFEQFEERQTKVCEAVSLQAAENPREGMQEGEQALDQIEEKEQSLIQRQQSIQDSQQQLHDDMTETLKKKQTMIHEIEKVDEKWATFREEEEAVRSRLAQFAYYTSDLFADQDNILTDVRKQWRSIQEERASVQAMLANLQEKWATLEGKDYYVPHHDLLMLKQRLARYGLSVVLGSEWLAEQAIGEAEKEAYLQHQPLLPYAILIEASQVNSVKQALKQVKELTQDLPLLFLVKSEDSLQPGTFGAEQTRFLPLWQEALYLYQPDSLRMYTSADYLHRFKLNLADEIQEKQNDLQRLREQENDLNHVKHHVEAFYRKFSQAMVAEWEQERSQLEAERTATEDQIAATSEKIADLQTEHKANERERSRLHKEAQNIEKMMEKVTEYLPYYDALTAKQASQSKIKADIEDTDARIRELNQRRQRHINEERQLGLQDYALEQDIESHDKDYERYHLQESDVDFMDVTDNRDDKSKEEIEAAYNGLKAEVEAIHAQLERKQSDRQNLEDLRLKSRQDYDDAMYEVTYSGVDREWIKDNRRYVTKDEVRKAGQTREQQEAIRDQAKDALQKASSEVQTCKGVWEYSRQQVEAEFERAPYEHYAYTDHQVQWQRFKQAQSDCQDKEGELKQATHDWHEWKRENREGRDDIQEWIQEKSEIELELERKETPNWDHVEPLTNEAWTSLNLRPRQAARRVNSERTAVLDELQKQKLTIQKAFNHYLHVLEQTNNSRVTQFTRDVRVIMDNNRLYDYDFVETQFLRIFEALDHYQEKYRQILEENERDQKHLINLCLRRAKTVYDSVMEIPKNSRVLMYDRPIQIVRMDWQPWDAQGGQEKMHRYLTGVLQDLQRWQEAGMDDDEINRRMEEMLRTRNLMDVLSPIEACRITVYKPRKESIARVQRPDYASWDEVSRWSGGEEYSIYITMFMILISHIRQQSQGNQNVWKVILADNPFGKASSPHILETVFQVANSNKIQLICLTAHKEENILQRFPVVYSLQLRNAYGKEVMRAEQMETGFYRYETPSGEGAQLGLTF